VLGYLGSVNKHLRLVVDSDAILNKEKMAMYTSKWHFRRRVNDASTTILDRIIMKTINQRRWKLPDSLPDGFAIPCPNEFCVVAMKCKKNRLLVLSALSDKKMMLSMYDLETLKNLATKETKFVGIGRSSILWQGGEWVVFKLSRSLFVWNYIQNDFKQIDFEGMEYFSATVESVFFDGNETILYSIMNNKQGAIMNLRTAETVFINWLQPEAMEPNMTVNWHTRTLAYKHRDGRYYLNKFNVDWDLISSIPLDIHDCYGQVDMQLVCDYLFVFYSMHGTPTRVFSTYNGSIIMRIPLANYLYKTNLRLRYINGLLIAEGKESGILFDVHQFNTLKMTQVDWLIYPKSQKRIIYKMITPELVKRWIWCTKKKTN
jgi:hypothetical protein